MHRGALGRPSSMPSDRCGSMATGPRHGALPSKAPTGSLVIGGSPVKLGPSVLARTSRTGGVPCAPRGVPCAPRSPGPARGSIEFAEEKPLRVTGNNCGSRQERLWRSSRAGSNTMGVREAIAVRCRGVARFCVCVCSLQRVSATSFRFASEKMLRTQGVKLQDTRPVTLSL